VQFLGYPGKFRPTQKDQILAT